MAIIFEKILTLFFPLKQITIFTLGKEKIHDQNNPLTDSSTTSVSTTTHSPLDKSNKPTTQPSQNTPQEEIDQSKHHTLDS